MKLLRFLIRYYPPGVIVEYEKRTTEGRPDTGSGVGKSSRDDKGAPQIFTRSIDLFDLTETSNVDEIVAEIVRMEPLITPNKIPTLKQAVETLREKLKAPRKQFHLFKILRAHILPLTNIAINKRGSVFVTGSYDRTCKLFDTNSGEELHVLEGHKNVVYAVAINNPFGDKVVTGSFDKTAKLWDVSTGKLWHTLKGHTAEIVCVQFDAASTRICTGSMDNCVKLWDVEHGTEVCSLSGHSAEVISVAFDTTGNLLLSGSFDHTAALWDARAGSGRRVASLVGHRGEISNAAFSFDANVVATSSMDKTARVWDVRMLTSASSSGSTQPTCRHVLGGHEDEVLDAQFDAKGRRVVTASADSTCRLFDVESGASLHHLRGHEGEVSKALFDPTGRSVLTASADRTARLWNADTGDLLQTLEGHSDEIFSCLFNYEGTLIVTASKDNTCRIWK